MKVETAGSHDFQEGAHRNPCGAQTLAQKRISNGEVIEKLQCLGGDWFTAAPVLEVGDAGGQKEKTTQETLLICLFSLRVGIRKSSITNHHTSASPITDITTTKNGYKISVLTFG